MGLFSAQIGTKQMVPLCRQLATSFDAGIPIIRTFEHVGSITNDGKVRRVLIEMTDSLKRGSTLGEAALSQRKFLSPFFIQLLASGERGGQIDIMLRDLAQYFEDRLEMQRMIRRMMAQPVFYLFVAWFGGTFAFGILGVVREAFAGTGGGTEGVMVYLGEYARFQVKAIIVFAGLVAIAIVLARLGLFGWISGAVTTFIWPISVVTRKFALARFFRSFALLLNSGLSITKCIEGAASVTANPYIQKDLLKAIPEIRAGATLVEAFSHSRQLTPMSREMLAIGEQSGKLELQMRKISQYHLEEATHATQVATRVFATTVFLLVAGLIGYIVISFYMNLYGSMFDELGI